MNSEQEPPLANEEPSRASLELPSPAGSLGSRISSHPAPVTDTLESSVAMRTPVTVSRTQDGNREHSLLLQEFKDLLRQYIGVKGCVNSSRFDLVANPKANENRRGPPSQSSVYRGVTRHMRTRKWEAHIWQRKQLYLGGFEDAVDAAKAHDIMSLKLKQEAATTNFMRESYRPLLPYINRLSWEYIMSALRQCTKDPSSLRVEGLINNQRGPYELRRPELRPRLEQEMTKRPRTMLAESTGIYRGYRRGQNLGGIASVPRPRSFGQVSTTLHPMSSNYNIDHGMASEHLKSYLDARNVPSAPDVQILSGRVIGNVVRQGSDTPEQVAEPAVVSESTSPVEAMVKTEAMSVPTTLSPDTEPVLHNCDMWSSGSSNDLEMKAAIRAVAGLDDYEIGSFAFSNAPSVFDPSWPPFW